MSSLRLALKQSLEESGQLAKQKERDRRKREDAPRRRRNRDRQQGPKKRGPGRPRKDESAAYQSPHRHAGSSTESSDDDEGSSSENEFSGSSDNDTNQASVDMAEAASALFEDSDDSDSDGDDSARKRKKKQKKKKRDAANRIQNHWKKKMGKPTGAKPSMKRARKRHSGGQASVKTAEKGSTGNKSSSSGKVLTVPPPASSVVAWIGQLSVEMQREYITAGQRVKVRFETKKKRDGKLIRRRKWYGGLVTGVSTGGSKIRIKYDDGTSEVSKFPDQDIIVDAEGNGRHRVSADEFLPPPSSEIEEAISPRPRYQSPSTNDDNSEPRERVRVKKGSSRKAAVSPKSGRLKLSISRDRIKDGTAKSHDTETSAPLLSLEIPSSRKNPSPETPGVPFSDSHDSTDSGFSHLKSSPDSSGRGAEHADTPAKSHEVAAAKSASTSQEEEGELGCHESRETVENSPSSAPGNESTVVETTMEQNEPQPHGTAEEKPNLPTKPSLTIRLIPPKTTKDIRKDLTEGSHQRRNFHAADDNAALSSDEDTSVEDVVDTHANAADNSPEGNGPDGEGKTTVNRSQEVSGMTEAMLQKPHDASVSGKKRPPTDLAGVGEEPAAKRHSGEKRDVERKVVAPSLSDPPTIDRMNEAGAVSTSQVESAITAEKEVSTLTIIDEHGESVDRGGPGESPQPAASPRTENLRSTINCESKGEGEEQENSSPTAKPMSRVRTPRDTGSPALLSGDLKQSTDAGELSKPVSKLASAVSLDASESSERLQEEKVLTSSRNSAFDRKDSAAGSDSGEPLKPLKTTTSDSDEETFGRSTTPLPPEHGDGSKGSSFPVARSGRRAAQQANQRIAARQEIVIQDPFAKAKKKREKPDFKPLPNSAGKRKHRSNELDDDDDDRHWVQCDNCSKWRILPSTVETEKLPKHWYCEMNVYDSLRNSCDAPEQTTEEIAKRKKRGKKARRVGQETKDGFPTDGIQAQDAVLDRVKGRPSSRSSEISEEMAGRPSGDSSPKPRRTSPTSTVSSAVPESPKSDNENVPQKVESTKKVLSALKKSKSNEAGEGSRNVANDESGVEVPAPKGKRGRKRAKDATGKENDKGKGGKGSKEAESQEWVQCEKCEKWRRLPPHISASDLPEVWYCDMNTWDPTSASCNAEEEKTDPNTREYNIFGSGQSSYGSSGKLSYRNLLFGSGRKRNRPISERMRAAESLFTSLSGDNSEGMGHPSVMYAKSSAFVPKKSHSSLEESGKMSLFDLMSHSNLWAELRGVSMCGPANDNQSGKSSQSFDELPKESKRDLKELVYHALGTSVLAGHEVLLEAQCHQWDKTPQQWEGLRALCTLDVVTSLLFELVKDGLVEVVRENTPQSVIDNIPKYRRVDLTRGEASRVTAHHEPSSKSRCMKISKPWKKAGASFNDQWCV